MVRRSPHRGDSDTNLMAFTRPSLFAAARPLTWALLGCVGLLVGCASSPNVGQAAVRGDVAVNTAQAKADTEQAVALIAGGKWVEAEAVLKRAIVADPMYGPAHNDLGLIHFAAGRDYEAAWCFERAAKLMPRRGEPHNNIGLVYERADRWPDAEVAYRMALDFEPQNAEFAGNLARVRIRQNKRDGTTSELLRLVVSNDSRPEWIDWAKAQLHRPATEPATQETP